MKPNKKVVVSSYGDESHLTLVTENIASPQAGEVQVAIECTAVSGADINMRKGTYPFQKKAPLTPGYSVVGRVVELGTGVSQFKVGDRIACMTKYDGDAQWINVPERFLVPVPDPVPSDQAVCLILDWMTAYQMLHRSARLKPGQRVFIHGLSGAVGHALMTLAKLESIEVYGTASAKNHAALIQKGAHPFDYANTQWIEQLRALGGVDAAFDPLGYESFDRSREILRKGGVLVGYGFNLPALNRTPPRSIYPWFMKFTFQNLLFWTGKRNAFYGIERTSPHFNEDLKKLLSWVATGKITPPIKQTFELDQIADAHRAWSAGGGIGSIVVRVNQS